MRNSIFVLILFAVSGAEALNRINLNQIYKPISMLPTRRILRGRVVGEARPYMVYLRAALDAEKRLINSHWLCGGVIFHERHILTSAACIEDVKHFYVISGTHKWIPPGIEDNECIINGAKKAVWKCLPKSHNFDGNDFDNIRWMVSDIAIVRVEDEFNFERKILGCDFIPQKILLNNVSAALEKTGTIGSIAGWGTTNNFVKIDTIPLDKAENSVDLLETDVIVISKKGCRNHWEERYHDIINRQMICTKDSSDFDVEGNACQEQEVNCKKLDDDFEDDDSDNKPILAKRRMFIDPKAYIVHTAAHRNLRKRFNMPTGGFCENDHGGPLVIGHGKAAMVIGIMTACLTKPTTQKCFGPFLFTSVYKYIDLITFCGLRDFTSECAKKMQTSNPIYQETYFDWRSHPDYSGPPGMDKIGKPILRNYAQTPLHPKWSDIPKHSTSNVNVSGNVSLVTTKKILPRTTKIPSNTTLMNIGKTTFLRSAILRSRLDATNNQSEIHTLKRKSRFSVAQRLRNTMSSNLSRPSSTPISLYLNKKVNLPVNNRATRNSTQKSKINKLFNMIQTWQQSFKDYLDA